MCDWGKTFVTPNSCDKIPSMYIENWRIADMISPLYCREQNFQTPLIKKVVSKNKQHETPILKIHSYQDSVTTLPPDALIWFKKIGLYYLFLHEKVNTHVIEFKTVLN